jgi:hypothetical protein
MARQLDYLPVSMYLYILVLLILCSADSSVHHQREVLLTELVCVVWRALFELRGEAPVNEDIKYS